ncbi:MAG TPA: hypothetical protein PKW30_05990 [Campylobacterales bacterium]|nr:hypothetical protein [Campylobacterales bacterium]
MLLDELLDEAVSKTIVKMAPIWRLEMKKVLFPKSIKGHEKAAEFLEISQKTLNMRLLRGEFVEGFHYEKKSDKIYMWDRDALLEYFSERKSK